MESFVRRSKNWGKLFVALLLINLGYIIFPYVVSAQEKLPGNIKIGPVLVHPGFDLQEEYTDNVFSEPKNPEYDWITTISPSLLLQLPFGPAKEEAGVRKARHLLQVQYRAAITQYVHHEWIDDVDHLADGLLNLDFPGGLEFTMAQRYYLSFIPPYTKEEQKKDYTESDTLATVSYRFASRYKAELSYKHEVKDFEKPMMWYYHGEWKEESDDYSRDEVAATLYYRFLPKTSVLFEYGYYRVNNEDWVGPSTDNTNQRVWVGLSWEPGAKITGTLKGGFITKSFDDKEGGSDEDNLGVQCELTYELSPYNRLILVGHREILQTYLTTKTTPNYGSTYVSSGINLGFRHNFTPKINGSAEGVYENLDFKGMGIYNKERQDNRYGGGVSIEYNIQNWLLLGLRYNYIYNNSNFPEQKYKENRTMFRVAAVL
jgi:hypothetical protein